VLAAGGQSAAPGSSTASARAARGTRGRAERRRSCSSEKSPQRGEKRSVTVPCTFLDEDQRGAAPQVRLAMAFTPLFQAARDGNAAEVRWLIEARADIENKEGPVSARAPPRASPAPRVRSRPGYVPGVDHRAVPGCTFRRRRGAGGGRGRAVTQGARGDRADRSHGAVHRCAERSRGHCRGAGGGGRGRQREETGVCPPPPPRAGGRGGEAGRSGAGGDAGRARRSGRTEPRR